MKKFSILLISLLFAGNLFFLSHQSAKAIGQTAIVQIMGPTQPPGFSPGLLTIHLYDTVVFVNHTNTPCSISSSDDSFSSPAIRPGQQWSVTFSNTGGHEYHATASTQHMVGEILVVSNEVSLLPTPVPQIEGTVVALIKAGKHPPDTIVLNPTTPTVKHNAPSDSLLSTILSPRVLGITGGSLLALFLIILSISLYRRHAKRKRDEEEMDALLEDIVPSSTSLKPVVIKEAGPVVAQATQTAQAVQEAPAKQKRPLLAAWRWKRSRPNDDDDDDIDDDEEWRG